MDSPIATATLQATALSALSNVLGQLLTCYNAKIPYNISLTDVITFALFSFLCCPPNYLWQAWLEATFPGYATSLPPREKEKLLDELVTGSASGISSPESLKSRITAAVTSASAPDVQKAKRSLNIKNTAIKFTLDQTLGAAFNTILFILGIAVLRGQGWQAGLQQTREGFWPLISAGQKLWPAVSLINLTLVPVEARTTFGSLVGVGWNVFLTLLSAKGKGKVH
ncbi:hypothetical protein LTR95_001677 [Oleoguttula sp. CCFEE 5521]